MHRQLYQDNRRTIFAKQIIQKESKPKTLELIKRELKKLSISLHIDDDKELHEWLLTIPGVKHKTVDGTHIYACNDPKPNNPSQSKKRPNYTPPNLPITQTPKRRNLRKSPVMQDASITSCRPNLESFQGSTSTAVKERIRPKRSALNEGIPQIYDHVIIGDDQFLNIVLFDMRYKQTQNVRPRQCGYCKSGLRIREAIEMIEELPEDVADVLINVGSVDIVEGRNLIDMMFDFNVLIDACNARLIRPVVTTLPPIPNCLHDDRKKNQIAFNNYIVKRLGRDYVIDIQKCFIHFDGSTNYTMYQNEPRYISGSRRAFLLWNSTGRKRVRNMITRDIGFCYLNKELPGNI